MNMKIKIMYKIFVLLMILLISLSNLPVNALHNIKDTKPTIKVNKNNGEENDIISNNIYDLLIISPKKFSKYIQPLVRHKNEFGVKTILADVEDVYEQMYWNGRDDAEKIKLFIKKSIEEWGVKYVLLIGGRKNQRASETWWIPVRYSHLDRKYDDFIERKFLSDLYFADIYDQNGNFSNWDDNNNGVYGEWPEDKAAEDRPDLFPDVYVGRLPCRNTFEYSHYFPW